MADDLIGALTSRVRELSLRVATLESELDAAHRRVRVYEEFDQTVQDALASALRSAFEIRERAENTASAIVDEAKSQRSSILNELEQLRAERERVQREVADARLTRDAVQHSPPTPAAAPQIPMSELRLAASEALRGVFKELVEEMRHAPQPARPAPAAAPRVVDPVPPPPQAHHEPPPARVESQVARIEPPPLRTAPAPPPRSEVAPAPAAAAPPTRPPTPMYAPAVIAEVAEVAEVEEADEVEEAPVRFLSAEPSNEVQLVLSPIPSFPRLVEIERRIQSLPVVRTLYVRDFRGGVATLAVGLRQAMASSEFAAALGRLEHPRLRVVSSSRNVLELRIDGESAIA